MTANLNRKAFSLTEILIVSAIAIVMITYLIDMGVGGQWIIDETSKNIQLQVGIRNVVENMVHDVNSSIIFLNTSNQKMILARYEKAVDDDLFLLNASTINPVFPYYLEGQQTRIQIPALFVEYEYSPEKQNVMRNAKKGVLECTDSENSPYVISHYTVNTAALTEVRKNQLATKVSYMNLKYFGYDDVTGQLRPIGELGGGDMVASKAAMMTIHIIAEDEYPQPNRRTPKMEIFTKAWSYRMIHENKYPEYFGHTDRDLRF
jgi:hypothetical protein